jgi:hypothetical protein
MHAWKAYRLELSETVHGTPMQTDEPNGVRCIDLLGITGVFLFLG